MGTNVNYFTQASAGAPAMSQVAGALIAILDWLFDVSNTNGRKVADKVYTGTNEAVYRFTTGHRRYLRVDDSDSANADLRGYESMSDVDTGVDAFPLVATYAGYYWRKGTGNYQAKVWGRGLILYVESYTSNSHDIYAWADLIREDGASDDWNTVLCGRAANNTAQIGFLSTNGKATLPLINTPSFTNALSHVCFCRSYDGLTKAVLGASSWGGTAAAYPSVAPFLYIAKIPLGASTNNITGTASQSNQPIHYRGYLPYLYAPMTVTSDASLAIDTTHTDGGSASYRMLKQGPSQTSVLYSCLLETTDTDPLVP